ncbi:MAG: KamA family radical SAM protein [Chlamydiales bacterium]
MWRKILRENFTQIGELCTFLKLNPTQCKQVIERPPFTFSLPRRLAHKIEKGTLDDPLFRQFVPLEQENIYSEEFVKNPVGDQEARITPSVLKKYQNRALLISTSACAMHCRYCFRRHFSYPAPEYDLRAIREDSDLNEIILSGGDPLSLNNDRLQNLLEELAAIPHIRRVRFHTRFPIGIPERIDAVFLRLLQETRLSIWFVVHINHARELDLVVLERLAEVRRLGIPVLNQSVLLRGVNDSVAVLQELFETLVDNGIIPYYLHQLDKVEGASHFEVSEERGLAIMAELAKRLSGYALPRYMREEAGLAHKTVIT